jgi:hypothetical protein
MRIVICSSQFADHATSGVKKQAKPFNMAFRATATAFAAALALAAARPLPTVRPRWAAANRSGLRKRAALVCARTHFPCLLHIPHPRTQ